MDSVARTRRRILALFLPVAAVLYVSCEGLNPKGTDQVITSTATAYKLLPIAAKHPTQLYLSGSCRCSPWERWPSRTPRSPRWSERGVRALATVAALFGGSGCSPEPSSTSWLDSIPLPPDRPTFLKLPRRASW